MITVVNTPTSVSTVSYRSLVADTMHVVQPDFAGAWPIQTSEYNSFVPEICNIVSVRLKDAY